MSESFQDEENKMNSRVDDEITIKDIILRVKVWRGLVWSRKILIISLSLVFGLTVAVCTKFLTKPSYTASYQLFFQEERSGITSAMRLASSFGLGGMSIGSSSSSAVVKEYITSRNNIAHSMIADLDNGRLIDRYYAEKFESDKLFLEEFREKFDIDKRYTDSVLTNISIVLNENVLRVDVDKKTGVLFFNVVANNESFTYDLATQLFKNTETQFKDWKRQKGLNAVQAFQRKVDSLELALDVVLRKLGEFQDQNTSLIFAVDKMEQIRMTIEMESLKVAYGEYLKGLEMSKVELMNLEGPFKYFDEPVFPLEKYKSSPIRAGIFGCGITAFLLVLFLIVRLEAGNLMKD